MSIPMTLLESLFDVYQVITMPIATSNVTSVGLSKISNVAEYLAINSDESYFLELLQSDLLHCSGSHLKRCSNSLGHDGFPSNSFWTVYRPKKHRPFWITWAAMWPYTTTNAGWSAVPTIYRTALHSAHNTIQNVFWWFRQPVWPRTVKIHIGYHLLKWWR